MLNEETTVALKMMCKEYKEIQAFSKNYHVKMNKGLIKSTVYMELLPLRLANDLFGKMREKGLKDGF